MRVLIVGTALAGVLMMTGAAAAQDGASRPSAAAPSAAGADDTRIAMEQGVAAYGQGRPREALLRFSQALDLSPGDYEALLAETVKSAA